MKIIPAQCEKQLSMAIDSADLDSVKRIVEKSNIDPNAYENGSYTPILMTILISFVINDEDKRLAILAYFLEKGANPNLKSKEGYNCLHVAVQHDRLARALSLFLDFGGDVNLVDNKGCTVAYWAFQSFPWRKTGDEREFHLRLLEKILMLGANLDLANKFGITPRKWLEHSPEDVKQLVEKCEKRTPIYKPSNTQQPKFPTNYRFPEIVEHIRENMIPVRGEADTIEGEMLRGLDILKDEAQRNGNGNYSKTHKEFAEFILKTLSEAPSIDKAEKVKIGKAVKKLMDAKSPYLDDDVYDYLTDQICIFYKENIKPSEGNKKNWWRFW